MKMNINAMEIERTRARIRDTAQSMLDGKCCYIEGARRICDMLEEARLDRFDKPFVTFVVIASETDEVPVGHLRDRWHPETKITLASKWTHAERYAKKLGEVACRDAVTWLAAYPSFAIR